MRIIPLSEQPEESRTLQLDTPGMRAHAYGTDSLVFRQAPNRAMHIYHNMPLDT